MRVAVAGSPNCGKSTLFNRITGARARVGNYPGVTVERKEAAARLPSGRIAQLIDLPGCYSLAARSPEEEVAHHVLLGLVGGERPELVVCVIDATNLARGLYLALQLLEMELPLVVAINMIDVAKEEGIRIDIPSLSAQLGCPVVCTSARTGAGVAELIEVIDAHQGGLAKPPTHADAYGFDKRAREALERVRTALRARQAPASVGAALWLLTSDLSQVDSGVEGPLLQLVLRERQALDAGGTGAFSRLVIECRYQRVDKMLAGVADLSRRQKKRTSERVDKLLLHPVGGLVVFALAMLVLFQAVFAWAEPLIDAVDSLMAGLGSLAAEVIPFELTRSLVVNGVIAGVGNVLVFLPQIALLFLGITLLEESGYMARAAFLLDRLMRRVGLHGKSFVPLMSGFACAVPAVMAARTVENSRDRLVTILITPFMSCSARLPIYVLVIAAVFSTVPPLGGVVSVGGLVVGLMYLTGFAAAVLTAWVLKRGVLRAPTPAFVLELPDYKMPLARDVARRVWERCRVFLLQTGSIILALSMLLWSMLTFPRQGLEDYQSQKAAIVAHTPAGEVRTQLLASLQRRDKAERLSNSAAGRMGHLIEPVIEPLGFDWRIGVGLIASFAAREVLVSTLGQVYALGSDVEADSPALRDALLADKDATTGRPRFSPLVGISLMLFFVLAMQCLSTLATVKRETNSWRWPLFQLAYMNGFAYLAALLVYQGGMLLGLGA